MFLVWTCSIILSSNSFAQISYGGERAPASFETATKNLDEEEKNPSEETVRREPTAVPIQKWQINSESKTVVKKVRSWLKRNKNIQPSEIGSLIQKKLKTDRYLTVRVDVNQSDYVINISNVKKYLILLEGNSALSQRLIKSSIDLDNLISSEESIRDDLILRIKQTYMKNGYNDINIKVEDKYFKDTGVQRFVFQIDEGLAYSFNKITINGSFSKNRKYYINFLRNRSSQLIKSGKFSKSDIENGLNNLIIHLKNLGYLEASYSGLRIDKDPHSKNKVHVYFDLYEGQPVRVQDIIFEGNKNVDSEWLSVLLGFKENDILDFYKLEEGIKQVYDYYLSTGYLEVEINPLKKDFVKLDLEKRRADIVVELIESDKVVVGEIDVIGLTKTQRYVVENTINFEVGDVLTVEKIATSRNRLNLGGLFSGVDIRFDEKLEGARKIVVEVEEKPPGVFQLGFGARFNQRALSLKGYTGVLYKNLGGTARALNTRLELQSRLNEHAYPEHRAFISYYEPFLFSKLLRGRVSVDSSENIFEISGPRVTLFRSMGVRFMLENNFNRNVRTSLTLFGIDFNKEYEINKLFEIREQVGYVGANLQLDYRNDFLLPTKGHYSNFSAELGLPKLGTKIVADNPNTPDPTEPNKESPVTYIRTESGFTKYSPLHPRLVWVNTVRGGWLRNMSEDTNRFPKSRAFFLGGSSTIRGFDPSDGVNERIPSNVDLNLQINTSARGGDVMKISDNSYFYLFKTEFRFPIFNELWGAIFYDGGSVLIDGVDFKDPYRDSSGFGIRWNTPIGAVTVDVGFKLDRDKSRGESLERIHINIGTF